MERASAIAVPSATGEAKAAALKRRFARHDLVLVALLFAALAAVAVIPDVPGWLLQEIELVVVYVIAAQGVSILTGYTGLVTVGHGAFLAIGAYTTALLLKYFVADAALAVIAGAAISTVIGILLGLVFLRLSGPFLAIGTLGFAFFVGAIFNNVQFFEGRTGISLPAVKLFGIELGDRGLYALAIGVLALVTVFFHSLTRSGVGRAFKALRDSEKAAQSCGINRWFYRTLSFAISACITGAAGALSALITQYVSAEVYGDIWYSVDILVAAVVGGPATLMGPFVGGAFVGVVPFFFDQLADFAFVLKGVSLIVVLLFAPAGVCEFVARPFRRWRERQLALAAEPVRGLSDTAERESRAPFTQARRA